MTVDVATSAQHVVCDNCNGPDPIAVIGLILAIVGAIAALTAAVLAHRAWQVAQAQLKIASAEHEMLLASASARAHLLLTIRAVHADTDGVIYQPGIGGYNAVVEIGIHNRGDRAAENVKLQVLVPEPAGNTLQWSGQHGDATSYPRNQRSTGEALPGRTDRSAYLTRSAERVSAGAHAVAYFVCHVHIGPEVNGFPTRVKVEYDAKPDLIDEVATDYEVRTQQRKSA